MKTNRTIRRDRPGVTLIDSVLSLFVLSLLVIIFGSLVTTREVNRRVAFRTQAAALADGEMNALRRLGFVNLPTQTDGGFLNTFYNAGAWRVVANGTAGHSAPNVVELPKVSGLSNQPSGRLQFPAGAYSTADLQAKWYVASDSPATWQVGYYFRMQDKDNGYRVRIAATTTDLDSGTAGTQNMVIEKLVDGTATILTSKASVPLTTDTWHTLRLVTDDTLDPSFRVYLDTNQQNTASLADTTYASGKFALLVWNGAHVYVDDAQTIVNGNTDTWNFDSSTDLPAAWTRLGLNDLPDNTPTTFDDNGTVTIQPYPDGSSTTLKSVSITISWRQNTGVQSYTTTSLIGKSGLGQ